jgi:hypothetical protein
MEGISSYERHNTTGGRLIPNPRGQINEEIIDIQEFGLKNYKFVHSKILVGSLKKELYLQK